MTISTNLTQQNKHYVNQYKYKLIYIILYYVMDLDLVLSLMSLFELLTFQE